MKKILQLKSSILGEYSASQALSDYTIELLNAENQYQVETIDVTELPHLTGANLGAISSAEEPQDEAGKSIYNKANMLIESFKNADVLVIGVPMYNFHVPSQLKSFFDYVARAGVTFKYTETGPVGLLEDKPVYLLHTYGGAYGEDDLITPYMNRMLGFMGLTDTHSFYAEALNFNDGADKDNILAATKEKIKDALAK